MKKYNSSKILDVRLYCIRHLLQKCTAVLYVARDQPKFRPVVERHWPEVVQMEGKAQVIRCKIRQCSLPPFPVVMFVKNLNLFRLLRNTLTNGLDNRHALLVLLTISSLWFLDALYWSPVITILIRQMMVLIWWPVNRMNPMGQYFHGHSCVKFNTSNADGSILR